MARSAVLPGRHPRISVAPDVPLLLCRHRHVVSLAARPATPVVVLAARGLLIFHLAIPLSLAVALYTINLSRRADGRRAATGIAGGPDGGVVADSRRAMGWTTGRLNRVDRRRGHAGGLVPAVSHGLRRLAVFQQRCCSSARSPAGDPAGHCLSPVLPCQRAVAQLLFCFALGRLYGCGRWSRVCYALILTGVVGANTVHTTDLLRYGRGDYQAAVQWMLGRSSDDKLTVGSDHDFRNAMVLRYVPAAGGPSRKLVYHELGRVARQGPEWIVLHSQQLRPVPPPAVRDDYGNEYRLERVFPFAGLSGWHWAVYRNENRISTGRSDCRCSAQARTRRAC